MNNTDHQTLNAWLAAHSNWSGDQNGITCRYTLPDFVEAMQFMQACISVIEAQQHHPEWSNVYNRIDITLKTHDAGDVVTSKDLDLAEALEQIFAGYRWPSNRSF